MTTLDTSPPVLFGPVSRRLAGRPRLAQVAADLLQPSLAQAIKAPVAASKLALGHSLGEHGPAQAGFAGYATEPLVRAVYRRFLTDTPPRLAAETHFLTDQPGSEYPRHLTVDFAAVGEEIDLAGPFLVQAWCERMASYFSAPGEDGQSPWGWLAEHLRGQVARAVQVAQREGTLSAADARRLEGLAGAGMAGPGPSAAGRTARLLTVPDQLLPVLLVEAASTGEPWLIYSLQQGFMPFATSAELSAWLGQPLAAVDGGSSAGGRVTDGIFAAWAGAILDGHLQHQRALAARMRTQGFAPEGFEAVMDAFPAAVLLDTAGRSNHGQAIRRQLPEWLTRASDTDRLRYGLGLRRVLAAQGQSPERDFLEGIPTAEAFARRRLIEEAARLHPAAPLEDPDDVRVSIFTREDDALLSIAGGGGSVTYHEQHISLIELSLLNTGGRPVGWMKVGPQPGKTLPPWLDDDAALALVRAIDVGSAYLALLHHALSVGEEGARRRRLFHAMIAPQLPLLALELSLRGAGHFDERGVSLVQRVCNPAQTGVVPEVGQLALEATPGAAPDLVTGTFIFCDPGTDTTLVLYCPLAAEPLRQFADRQALMQAIIHEPELSHWVLTWLSDTAQVRYRDGGLRAPHWLRFGQGDEFAPQPRVAPARAVVVAVAGRPLDAFYDGVARALTLAADRQTVSNQESFWISARALGWVIFNQLLPFATGPAATAGWLIQLGHTLDEQYNAVGATEVAEAPSGTALIFELAVMLLTEGFARARLPQPGRRPSAPLPAEPATAPVLDLAWATPGPQPLPPLRQRLLELAVEAPDPLAPMVTTGPFRGLIPFGQRWLARVDEQLFEVTPADGQVQVLDRSSPGRQGPWLLRDEAGRWRFDLRLRLRGGGPKRRLEQQRQLNEQLRQQASQYVQEIEENYRRLRTAGQQGDEAINAALQANDLAAVEARRQEEMRRLEAAFQVSERARLAYQAAGQKVALPDYNKELSTALGVEINMCGYYLSLSRERMAAHLRANEGVARAQDGSGGMSAEQARRWFAFLREHVAGVEAIEPWLARLEQRLAELRDIPVFGARLLEQLKPKMAVFRSRLDFRVLEVYLQLSALEEPMLGDPGARQSFHNAMKPLVMGLITHREVARDLEMPEGQAVELLDGVISAYQAAEDTIQWLKQTLRPEYATAGMDRLVVLVAALREEAEARMGRWVKEGTAPQPAEAGAPRVPVKATGQRVIRTRNRGSLIARVRKKTPRQPEEVAEIMSPLGDTVVATFTHDADRGDWVEAPATVVEPDPASASRADLERLLHEADRRLESAERQLEQAPRLGKVTRIPLELEELMANSAFDLRNVAERIERALTRINETDTGVPGYGSAEVKAHSLRSLADRLVAEGRRLRIELTKTALPTPGRVRYLVEQGEARVRRLGTRVLLKGQGKRKDIVQEYVIEAPAGKALWYGHFHYAGLDSPDDQYVAAHLKTVSQRYVGLSTQMAQATNNAEVVKIYRSRIDPVTAKALFLNQP